VNHPAMLIHLTAQPGEQISIRDEAWAHEHRRSRDDGADPQFDAMQVIVVDHQPRDRALDDPDATGSEAFTLLRADVGAGTG
jgi:hypothetical protein